MIIGGAEQQALPFEVYGAPVERFHMAPKYVKRWADAMGLSAKEYLDLYEAECAAENQGGTTPHRTTAVGLPW